MNTVPPGINQIRSVPGSSSTIGLGLLSGGLLEILAILASLAIVGIVVIVVVANRADPDPSGNRPASVYFFSVSFVTLLVSILASTVMVIAVVLLIGHHGPIGNDVARAEVLGGLLLLISMVLFVRHLGRGLDLARASREVTSPSKRVGQSYVGIMSFLMVVLFLLSTVASIYLLFSIAAPGVFGSFGGRADAVRDLIVTLYLAGVAVVIAFTHRDLVSPGLTFRGATTTGTEGVPEPVSE